MKLIVRLAIFCLLVSCVDPYKLELKSEAGALVIDGLITNLSEIQTVKLSRSLTFNNKSVTSTYFIAETGAQVRILDKYSRVINMLERYSGVYTTSSEMEGEAGNSYKLEVITKEGEIFESSFEEMQSVAPIEDITYQFHKSSEISKFTGRILTKYNFIINVKSIDPIDTRNFYRWKSSGVIEFFSSTEGAQVSQCWVTTARLESHVEVADDRFFDGKTFSLPIAIAPYERPTRFKVEVHQYSLSERGYNYWLQISNQQQNVGSIFDATPSQIEGNIKSISNPEELVLGYFGASSVSKEYLVFDRYAAANFIPPENGKPLLMGDCIQHEHGATHVRPEGF